MANDHDPGDEDPSTVHLVGWWAYEMVWFEIGPQYLPDKYRDTSREILGRPVPVRPERCANCHSNRHHLNNDTRWECDLCGCAYPDK